MHTSALDLLVFIHRAVQDALQHAVRARSQDSLSLRLHDDLLALVRAEGGHAGV